MTPQEQVEKLRVGVLGWHKEIISRHVYQWLDSNGHIMLMTPYDNMGVSHDLIASCLAKLTKEERLILCMRPNAGYRTMIEWIGLSISEQAQAILKVKGLL